MTRLWTKVFVVALAAGLLVVAGSWTNVSAAPASTQPILLAAPQDENISLTNEDREFDLAFDSAEVELDGQNFNDAFNDLAVDSQIDNELEAVNLDRNQKDGKPK